MIRQNFLSGRDKELFEMAGQFEQAQQEGRHIYMDADDWADLADWYAIHKKDSLAIEAAQNGLDQHPCNTALLVELSYLYLDGKQVDKACAVAACIEESKLPEVKILKANLHLSRGEDWKAEEYLEEIEDKDSLSNVVEIAYAYIDNGYPDRALPWLMRGESRHGNKEAFLTVKAEYHYAMEELEEAKVTYNKLIDFNPYSAIYWVGLQRCYLDLGELDKSIEAGEFAVVAEEEFGEAYLLLGNAYMQLGNEEKTWEYYQKAHQYKCIPLDFYHTFIGMYEFSRGHWLEAAQAFEEAVQNMQWNTIPQVMIYASLANCHHKLGNYAQAHDYCRKGLEVDANDVDCRVLEGTILISEGLEDEGMQYWEKLLESSRDTALWWEVAMAALDKLYPKMTLKCLEGILQIDPTYPNLREYLAITYLMMNNLEKFSEHNRLCSHPIPPEEVTFLQGVIRQINQDSVSDTMKKIFESLNNKNEL